MKRKQRGGDWYVIDGKLVRLGKPTLVDWTIENRVRAVAAVGMVVLLIGLSVHLMFGALDRQIALDDAKNAQQWSDFYAAQGE